MKTHGPLSIDYFVEPSFQENAYLLWPTGQADAWIVDPGFPPQPAMIAAAVAQHGLSPRTILLTHGHVDHIAGVKPVRDKFPEAAIWVPAGDAPMLEDPLANFSVGVGLNITAPPAERLLAPGETLNLGPLTWRVLDVAGHSPGGAAFYCPDAGVVLTGDALFAGSVGRVDFPGSSGRRLRDNLRAHLLSLPDETAVYSGHGPPTTIGRERRSNPFLQGDLEW